MRLQEACMIQPWLCSRLALLHERQVWRFRFIRFRVLLGTANPTSVRMQGGLMETSRGAASPAESIHEPPRAHIFYSLQAWWEA
jgi:hypothetical protein